MRVVVCLAGGMGADDCAIAEGAARLAFSDPIVLAFRTLGEASRPGVRAVSELLVLANPGNAELAEAAAALDANGLPRWAIVAAGATRAMEGVERVLLEEWNEPRLARVFGWAVARHDLRRENARLRGDLRAIAHRIMHDLRTPLGGILTAGEALKEALAEHEPASAMLAKPLFDSVDDMRRLLDRVKMLTKASAEPVSKVPVAMSEVVLRVLQGLERQILKRGAVVAQAAHWPEVEGVPAWLETVWSNLLVNAVQHGSGAGGIELGWSQAGGEFRFWVSNRRGRVPQEKLRALFQPFHLLYESNAKRGLGLSMVQRLVELQGGNCGYEPLSPDGSTFFFTLPAGTTPEAAGAGPLAATALCATG